MAKILFLIEPGTYESMESIVQSLIADGHHVEHESIDSYKKCSDNAYLAYVNSQKFDIVVFTIHVNLSTVIPFFQGLQAKKIFFIPHDLFSTYMDGPAVYKQNKGRCFAIPLTPIQDQYAKAHQMLSIPARFPKLDLPVSTFSSGVAPEDTGIFADSALFKDHIFPYQHLFKRFLLKRWNEYEYTPVVNPDQTFKLTNQSKIRAKKYGILEAPEELYGMKGLKAAVSCSKFWFIRDSSLYVEALLHDIIPILYKAPRHDSFEKNAKDNDFITHSEYVTSTVDEVSIALLGNLKFYAVTEHDIATKIDLLRDLTNYSNALRMLKQTWIFNDALPTVLDILRRYICK